MKLQNITPNLEDILALEKIIELIKEFTKKNPLKKIKFNKLLNRIEVLKQIEKSEPSKFTNQFKIILKKLKHIVKNEIVPTIFLISGGHGGIIIDDIGFCEFDDPKYAMTKLLKRMELAIETNIPYNIEIAICCLKWVYDKYRSIFSEFIKLFRNGKFEIINPTYSQPYNLIIGAESNIKQFEYGLKILDQLKLGCKIYYCSEFSLHPQIPQILNGFNIKLCSIRTRLLGMCPTTHSGSIIWIGLDNSRIKTLTDQSGVFNGEYWHGTFYQELPNLLFQAIARPFMKNIIFSSIEDFIMPLPYQKEVWRISNYSNIFGKFILCHEFSKFIPVDGEFKYNRDEFFIGDYIFIPNNLFLYNKNCEISIITAEIINSILLSSKNNSNDEFFNSLWEKLLLAQAHDNYAVPFIRNGDYSAQQLSLSEYKMLNLKNEKTPISIISLELLKEIQNKCTEFINQSLNTFANNLEKTKNQNHSNTIKFLIFNPTIYDRKDMISIDIELDDPKSFKLINEKNDVIDFHYENSTIKFISEITSMGYKIYYLLNQTNLKQNTDLKYFYKISLSENKKSIKIEFQTKTIYELSFESDSDYTLELEKHFQNNIEDIYLISGKFNKKKFFIEIKQFNSINRLEFILKSNNIKSIILTPRLIISKSFINYPFGFEETKRTKIQSLDFIYLTGTKYNILYIQKNCQNFNINHENFVIKNIIKSDGIFEFTILTIKNNDTLNIYKYLILYYYKLIGIKIYNNFIYTNNSDSFFSIKPEIPLVNLWKRKNNLYLRIFNPSNEIKLIRLKEKYHRNSIKEVDLLLNELNSVKCNEIKIKPFKILTLKI
ncbi:MAG: hypothetical protein ACTSPY_05735 [Candidatus Helarchaeota archaeon]